MTKELPFEKESLPQKALNRLGLRSLAWSLRRLHCPVPSDALVLEVGSGGNPMPRANVLVDAFLTTRQRHWAPLRTDRKTVLALGENLPFKDKAFDFAIACHVLEHSANPDRFLSELQRVAKAGYIETPDAFFERINPYSDHRLEIALNHDELIIRKKASWEQEPDTVRLYEHKVKPLMTRHIIPNNPEHFHVRYYWRDRIRWRVLNPETDANWQPPASTTAADYHQNSLRQAIIEMMQIVFSQRDRNQRLDLFSLLRCVACRDGGLHQDSMNLVCSKCGAKFKVEVGIPSLLLDQHPK